MHISGFIFRLMVMQWDAYLGVLLASFIINCLGVLLPLFAMNVYDRVVPNNAIETLAALSLGILIAISLDFILRLIRFFLLSYSSIVIDDKISSETVAALLFEPAHKSSRSKSLIYQSIIEASPVRGLLSANGLSLIVDLPFCGIYLVIVFIIAGNLFWIPLIAVSALLTLVIIAYIVERSKMVEFGNKTLQKKSYAFEIINNLSRIKLLNARQRFLDRWKTVNVASHQAQFASDVTHGLVTLLSTFVMQLSYVAIVIFGVLKISQLELTLGGLIAVSILSTRFLSPIPSLLGFLVNVKRSQFSIREIGDVLESVEKQSAKMALADLPRLPPNETFHIEIRNGRKSFSEPSNAGVILDLSLQVMPGEHIAIMGRVGAGKTTLFNILNRSETLNSGTLLLNGIDSNKVNYDDFLSNISALDQVNTLFDGSVYENLAIGGQVEASEITNNPALELVGLNSLVRSLPMGLNTQVGGGGRFISGGQRQLIRLSKIIIDDKPTIFLDEPSTGLDKDGEAQLIQGIKDLWKTKTLVLCTHRISFLELVDRVIVLSEGRIVIDESVSQFKYRLSKDSLG